MGFYATMGSIPSVERDLEIIESDGGYKAIEENRNKVLEEARVKREKAVAYKNLGRNDVCLCGSGKKYKKCCLTKYTNI